MSTLLFKGFKGSLLVNTTRFITRNSFSIPVSQNPREADAMTKVQAELDETKIILVSFL